MKTENSNLLLFQNSNEILRMMRRKHEVMITADSSLSPLVKSPNESNEEEQNAKGYKEIYGG